MKKLILISLFLLACGSAFCQEIIDHIVSKGETLESIASQYGISTGDIVSLNPSAGRVLYIGQKLRIKTVPSTSGSSATGESSVTGGYLRKAAESTAPVISYPTEQTQAPRTSAQRTGLEQPQTTQQAQYQTSQYPKVHFSGYLGTSFDLGKTKDLKGVDFGCGGIFGAGLNFPMTEHFAVGAWFEYKFIISSEKESGLETKSSNHYLGAPIQFSFVSEDRMGTGIRFGVYLGGHVGGHYKMTYNGNKQEGDIDSIGELIVGPQVNLQFSALDIGYRAEFINGVKGFVNHCITLTVYM